MGCAGSRPESDASPVYKANAGSSGTSKPMAAVAPDDEADEQRVVPTLSGPMKEQVMDIFKKFDMDTTGKIPLESLQNSKMSVGPSEVAVLKYLADMDFNGDGYVEVSEWEMYFANTLAVLTEAETKDMMEELSTAGDQMQTIAMCTKLAAEGDTGPSGPVDPEDEIEAPPMLDGEQKEMITSLFAEWDFNGNGLIDRGQLQGTGVTVGPRTEKVFSSFEQMDTDNDGQVTLQEMLDYFGVAASLMSADEFKSTITEMTEVAGIEKAVAVSVELAAEGKAEMATAPDEGDEPPEPPPELTEARKALVKALFTAFSADLSPIDLSAITAAGKIESGPSKEAVLEGLVAMDANGDGKVEMDEMLLYFTYMGEALNDDEFNTVLEELKDNAMAGQMLREASLQDGASS